MLLEVESRSDQKDHHGACVCVCEIVCDCVCDCVCVTVCVIVELEMGWKLGPSPSLDLVPVSLYSIILGLNFLSPSDEGTNTCPYQPHRVTARKKQVHVLGLGQGAKWYEHAGWSYHPGK